MASDSGVSEEGSDSGPHCLSAHQVCARHTHFPGSAIICARTWGIYPQAHWTLLDSQAALSEARRLPQLKVLGLVQRTGAPAGEALVLAPAHFRGCARLIMHFWVYIQDGYSIPGGADRSLTGDEERIITARTTVNRRS